MTTPRGTVPAHSPVQGAVAAATEGSVRDFYAALQYPGPDAIVTTVWARRLAPFLPEGPFRFLDAGCGAGRHSAGMLRVHPESSGVGLDISEPSLEAARILMRELGFASRMEFVAGSMTETLPFGAEFDVVLAIGTVHHCISPDAAFGNLAAVLKTKGVLACMIYGERGHRRRYEIKEALELMGGDLPTRRRLYQAYRRRFEGFLDRTPRQIQAAGRARLARWKRTLLGRREDAGYMTAASESDVFFSDAYMSPVDVAFDTRGLRRLLDGAGLALEHMFSLGREDPALLPPEWRERWHALDQWDRLRVSELVDPAPTSLSFVARKPAN